MRVFLDEGFILPVLLGGSLWESFWMRVLFYNELVFHTCFIRSFFTDGWLTAGHLRYPRECHHGVIVKVLDWFVHISFVSQLILTDTLRSVIASMLNWSTITTEYESPYIRSCAITKQNMISNYAKRGSTSHGLMVSKLEKQSITSEFKSGFLVHSS